MIVNIITDLFLKCNAQLSLYLGIISFQPGKASGETLTVVGLKH
jgi:hypothetical protein